MEATDRRPRRGRSDEGGPRAPRVPPPVDLDAYADACRLEAEAAADARVEPRFAAARLRPRALARCGRRVRWRTCVRCGARRTTRSRTRSRIAPSGARYRPHRLRRRGEGERRLGRRARSRPPRPPATPAVAEVDVCRGSARPRRPEASLQDASARLAEARRCASS